MKSTELAEMFGDYYNPKDKEWTIILEKLNDTGIDMTDDYKTAYLRNMEKLCYDIKNDQAFEHDRVLTVGLTQKLIENYFHGKNLIRLLLTRNSQYLNGL